MANQLNLHNIVSVREEYTTLSGLNIIMRRIISTDTDGNEFCLVLFGTDDSRSTLESAQEREV